MSPLPPCYPSDTVPQSDFNTTLADSGTFLDGFSKVHKGFKDRVYPERVSELGEIRPYDAIALAIRTVSKHLRKEAKKRGKKHQEVC